MPEGVGFEPTSDFRRCRFSGPGSRVSTCIGLGMCRGGAAFNLRDPLLQPFQVMVLNVLKRELTMLGGQTVVQGRRPTHPIRLFPNAITASVNPGNSAASFSATAAPGGDINLG